MTIEEFENHNFKELLHLITNDLKDMTDPGKLFYLKNLLQKSQASSKWGNFTSAKNTIKICTKLLKELK